MNKADVLPTLVLSLLFAGALGASVALWLHYGGVISFEAMSAFVKSCF